MTLIVATSPLGLHGVVLARQGKDGAGVGTSLHWLTTVTACPTGVQQLFVYVSVAIVVDAVADLGHPRIDGPVVVVTIGPSSAVGTETITISIDPIVTDGSPVTAVASRVAFRLVPLPRALTSAGTTACTAKQPEAGHQP
jgi:hypothetical protein